MLGFMLKQAVNEVVGLGPPTIGSCRSFRSRGRSLKTPSWRFAPRSVLPWVAPIAGRSLFSRPATPRAWVALAFGRGVCYFGVFVY